MQALSALLILVLAVVVSGRVIHPYGHQNHHNGDVFHHNDKHILDVDLDLKLKSYGLRPLLAKLIDAHHHHHHHDHDHHDQDHHHHHHKLLH